MNFFAIFLVLFDMKLPGDYFGMKIRKIEPVINPVEGLKVKFPLILAHPVMCIFACLNVLE